MHPIYVIEEEATSRRFCADTADRCWETAKRLGWVEGDREAEWQAFPKRFENDFCSIIPIDEEVRTADGRSYFCVRDDRPCPCGKMTIVDCTGECGFNDLIPDYSEIDRLDLDDLPQMLDKSDLSGGWADGSCNDRSFPKLSLPPAL